ncbi:MAG: hypothetical protein IJS20_02490 [Bacteroidales bacterium]|nr:hypothetical protein [Bacteroidales bacterium]
MKEMIQYKYSKITEEQFATFEENYDPTSPVQVNNTVSFSFNFDNNTIICSEIIVFSQLDKIVLKAGLSSYFSIHPDSINELTNNEGISFPKEILWQFASLNYGCFRGVLFEKTKDTALNSIILPPFYFDSLIKEGLVFSTKSNNNPT